MILDPLLSCAIVVGPSLGQWIHAISTLFLLRCNICFLLHHNSRLSSKIDHGISFLCKHIAVGIDLGAWNHFVNKIVGHKQKSIIPLLLRILVYRGSQRACLQIIGYGSERLMPKHLDVTAAFPDRITDGMRISVGNI